MVCIDQSVFCVLMDTLLQASVLSQFAKKLKNYFETVLLICLAGPDLGSSYLSLPVSSWNDRCVLSCQARKSLDV